MRSQNPVGILRKKKCCIHVSAWDIWVLFLQPLHSKVLFRRLAMAISPHKLHTWSLQNHQSSLLIKSKHVKDENKVNIKCEPVWIGDFKKPLSQELSSSMRDLAISLHLAKPSVKIWRTKRYALKSAISHDVDICYGCARLSSDKERAPEASVPCSSLHGLPHENLHRPSGPVAVQVIWVLEKPEKIHTLSGSCRPPCAWASGSRWVPRKSECSSFFPCGQSTSPKMGLGDGKEIFWARKW